MKQMIKRPIDLIGLGIIKRKLTRKESNQIMDEIMDMNIKDTDLRFRLAIIKTIDTVN